MQTEKSQLKGKRIMLDTRFTECPALSVDPRVGILNLISGIIRSPCRWNFSVCIGNRCLIIFLTYDNIFFYLSFDILRRITTFSEPHSVLFFFSFWYKSDVTSEIYSSDVTFNVACGAVSAHGQDRIFQHR